MPESKPEQPQLDKFRQLARDLETDEDEKRFEETVKKVAKAKSPHQGQKPND